MPKTLLLADDSVTIQKVVGISFANEDVVLLTVDNGDDAVIRAREARPDLVLADVMMPGKDGYEVCETLKADPELRHVPVLLLSGTFEPFDEERARRAGADGHITKPFEAQALVDQVNALLASTPAPAEPLAAPAGDATLAVGSDAGDAFDFFDEELAQTAPSPSLPAATPLDDEGDPLELETAVEDDDSMAAAPLPGDDRDAAGDSQATVLLEDEPPALTRRSAEPPQVGDGFDAEALATPAPIGAPPVASAASPAGYEESFDFGFEDDADASATALVSPAPAPTPPAHEAATRIFDDEPAPPPAHAVTRIFDDEPAPLPAQAVTRIFDDEPVPPPAYEAATRLFEDELEPDEEPLPALSPPPTPMPEPPVATPTSPPMPPASESWFAPPTPPPMSPAPESPFATPPPPPMGSPAPESPFATPAPPSIPTPLPPPVPQAAPPPVASAPAAETSLAVPVAGSVALSEPIQKQLQETLEKIVWEAFGDLSERIVRDVIERVESVAWEVIPQMAETLIREEIRKLKGEDA